MILYLNYALWMAEIPGKGFPIFECEKNDDCVAWAGGVDFIYQTNVAEDDLETFRAACPERTVVADDDEVIARVHLFAGVKVAP